MKLAIIPARGGSKRIPAKNIKEFMGKPVMAYAIEAASRSGLFAHVLVSTDCAEIAEVARRFGAETPFPRPAELGGDHVTTDAVLVHAVEEAQRLYGPAEQACCIYPANPLLDAAALRTGLELLLEHQAPCAFERCQDINGPQDWAVAELKYLRLRASSQSE
jgi:CMP-N-acetylneuraminic acid synthetase